MKNTPKTVYVGLSGGVDSSVAAYRLKKQGHTVVGVFIKVWQPEFLTCNWEMERLDAMRVAAHLKIPFLTFDAEAAYKQKVADYMIDEYRRGRIPNPDVMCNTHVKFGVFLDFALQDGADFVATGHYARVQNRKGQYDLLRGVDTEKDQSYFLWMLDQEQLAHTLFPVGDTKKRHIREEAARAGLPTSDKPDSQGVCFLGEIDMKEFLSHYVPQQTGDVLNERGVVLGTHDGALFYTLGQRHGFTITTHETRREPRYVIGKNLDANTITVGNAPVKREGQTYTLAQCNFIGELTETLFAQFRYRQKPFAVTLTHDGGRAMLTVQDTDIEAAPSGQSAVLYAGERCLGGGILET